MGLPFSPAPKEGDNTKPSIMTLSSAMQRSACVDIPSLRDIELLVINSPYKIDTGYYGPIPANTVGLLLGRSSCTMKMLYVMTGVIDEDYDGEISIMVQVTRNIYLQKGDCFAQMLLLPYEKPQKSSQAVRAGGFGSTNFFAGLTALLQELEKPILTLNIRGKNFKGMLDTGADISIIRLSEWPREWPLLTPASRIIGVGEANLNKTF